MENNVDESLNNLYKADDFFSGLSLNKRLFTWRFLENNYKLFSISFSANLDKDEKNELLKQIKIFYKEEFGTTM